MGQQITMNMQIIQLLALAGIAIYLILKLRGVLGTRDGHEGPRANIVASADDRPKLEVIDGGPDQDITCLLYTSPSPRDRTRARMPSSA